MSDSPKNYREGNDEEPVTQLHPAPSVPAQQPAPAAASTDAPKEAGPVVTTAVLLLQFEDGRVDAITDLPQVEKHHSASLREVRMMAQSLIYDISAALQAKVVVAELKSDVARAQAQAQLNSQISKIQNTMNMPGVKK